MRLANLILAGALGAALASGGCRNHKNAAQLPDAPPAPPTTQAASSGGSSLGSAAGREAAAAPGAAKGASGTPILSGTLEPHRRSTLMPRVGGPIVKVHVREGDVVKRGAALVTVDPSQYRLTKRQAEAGLEAAKVQLAATKLQWDRQRALLAEKAVPQGQFDMVDAKYKGALVGVKAAEVSLAMARKALRDTTVRAPYTGVVIKRHVSEGDFAAAMPPTALITMQEIGLLDLRVQVPAADMGRVKAGDLVTIHFPGGGLTDLKAKIARIIPTVSPGTRTFAAIVELENEAGTLRPGLFAEVSIGTPLNGATPAPAATAAPTGQPSELGQPQRRSSRKREIKDPFSRKRTAPEPRP